MRIRLHSRAFFYSSSIFAPLASTMGEVVKELEQDICK